MRWVPKAILKVGSTTCLIIIGIVTHVQRTVILGTLSKDVFERRTSTGSEPFSLLISLDATVFILPSVLILIETICAKIYLKSRLKSAKRPLPVEVRRSKTLLLKLPNVGAARGTGN